jgi:hypothetical protein
VELLTKSLLITFSSKPLAVDILGNILKFDGNQWVKHIGQAKQITAQPTGHLYMLEQQTGELYQFRSGSWQKKAVSSNIKVSFYQNSFH